MREEVKRMLDEVRSRLKEGCSVKEALKAVRLGWKTYYAYKDYIYHDLGIPIREKRIADNIISITRQVILWPVARHTSRKLIMRKYKTVKFDPKLRKEARRLAKALIERWTNEVFLEWMTGS